MRLRWKEFFITPAKQESFPKDAPEWLEEIKRFSRFWFSEEEYWTTRSSGSTSAPKSIQLSRTQIECSARKSLDFFQFDKEKTGFALILPAASAGGFMLLARAFAGEIDVLIFPPKNEIPAPEDFPADRKWFLPLLPMQLHSFLHSANAVATSRRLSGILLGGGAFENSLLSSIQKLECPVFHSYGMTETASHIALRQLHPGEIQSAFQPLKDIHIRLNADSCLEINAGLISGGQWLSTNDLAEILPDASFRILGRADHTINSGGLKIQPETEKEFLLPLLPEIYQDIELLGLPDPLLGEKLVLVIFSLDMPNLEPLLDLMKQISDPSRRRRLPKAVYLLESKRPALPGGKTDFIGLRKKIQEISPLWEKSRPNE